MNNNPTVTVIIPVLNAREELEKVLKALKNQSWPADALDVIIVDNGSDSDLSGLVHSFGATFLVEDSIKSPYAARNKGLQQAGGDIIALTDANKIPDERWVEMGVACLAEHNADLAGGDIKYDLPNKPRAAELFDSLYFNNNRTVVENEGGSVTGNLFFKTELIQAIGYFPSELRSGMDVWWTQKAVREGYKLVFAEKAIVTCSPRKLKGVAKKSYRVGRSHPVNMVAAGQSVGTVFWTAVRTFLPPSPTWAAQPGVASYGKWLQLKFWFTAWLYKMGMGAGRIRGLFFLKHHPIQKSEK